MPEKHVVNQEVHPLKSVLETAIEERATLGTERSGVFAGMMVERILSSVVKGDFRELLPTLFRQDTVNSEYRLELGAKVTTILSDLMIPSDKQEMKRELQDFRIFMRGIEDLLNQDHKWVKLATENTRSYLTTGSTGKRAALMVGSAFIVAGAAAVFTPRASFPTEEELAIPRILESPKIEPLSGLVLNREEQLEIASVLLRGINFAPSLIFPNPEETLTGWIAPANQPDKERGWDNELPPRLIPLNNILQSAQIMVGGNRQLFARYDNDFARFVKEYYVPEIIRVAGETELDMLALCQFMAYNGQVQRASFISKDTRDTHIQTAFGALDAMQLRNLDQNPLSDAVMFGLFYLTQPIRGIRSKIPTLGVADMELEVMAGGINALREHNKSLYEKIGEKYEPMTQACIKLSDQRWQVTKSKSQVEVNIDLFLMRLNNEDIALNLFLENILRDPRHPFWERIGLSSSSDNLIAKMYQATNYTLTWEMLAKHELREQMFSMEVVDKSIEQARSEICGTSSDGVATSEKLVRLFKDQIFNQAFRAELEEWMQQFPQSAERIGAIMNAYDMMNVDRIKMRDMMAEVASELIPHQFEESLFIPLMVGMGKYLSTLTKRQLDIFHVDHSNSLSKMFWEMCARETMPLDYLVPASRAYSTSLMRATDIDCTTLSFSNEDWYHDIVDIYSDYVNYIILTLADNAMALETENLQQYALAMFSRDILSINQDINAEPLGLTILGVEIPPIHEYSFNSLKRLSPPGLSSSLVLAADRVNDLLPSELRYIKRY